MEQIQLSAEELQALKQANLLKALTLQEGWSQVLLPYLQSQINHSWVDPRRAKSDEDLLYEYKLGWARAMAVEEIISFVNESEETAKKLLAKQKGETKDKLREAVS